MNSEWPDEPTNPTPDPETVAWEALYGAEERGERRPNEGCTVMENRESLLALVYASVTVPDARGGELPPMSETLRRTLTGIPGVVLPRSPEDPQPTRIQPPSVQGTLRRYGPLAMMAVVGFGLGMLLRYQPPARVHAGQPSTAWAAGTAVAAAPASTAKGVLRITSSPPGALVTLDDAPLPGRAPHTVVVDAGRTVRIAAQLDGFSPATRTVVVNGKEADLEIQLMRPGAR